MAEYINCSNCGKTVKVANYCRYCGHKQSGDEPRIDPPEEVKAEFETPLHISDPLTAIHVELKTYYERADELIEMFRSVPATQTCWSCKHEIPEDNRFGYQKQYRFESFSGMSDTIYGPLPKGLNAMNFCFDMEIADLFIALNWSELAKRIKGRPTLIVTQTREIAGIRALELAKEQFDPEKLLQDSPDRFGGAKEIITAYVRPCPNCGDTAPFDLKSLFEDRSKRPLVIR